MEDGTNKPQEQKSEPINWVEKIQEDALLTADARVANDPISVLEGQMEAIRQDMERADAELEQLVVNPSLIPVPEDEKLNPLYVIGAGLRAMGGDTSSLEEIVVRKQRAADYQRQVRAQNVVMQNEFNQQQRATILDRLNRQSQRLQDMELAKAETQHSEELDQQKEIDANERNNLLDVYGMLEEGAMTAEEFFANDQYMAFMRKHRPGDTKGTIIAKANRGRDKRVERELLALNKARTAAGPRVKPFEELTKNWTDKDLAKPGNMELAKARFTQQFGIENPTDDMIAAGVDDPHTLQLSPASASNIKRNRTRAQGKLAVFATAFQTEFADKTKSLPAGVRDDVLAAMQSGTLTQDDVDKVAGYLGAKFDEEKRTNVISAQERATLREIMLKALSLSNEIAGYDQDLSGAPTGGGAVDSWIESRYGQ